MPRITFPAAASLTPLVLNLSANVVSLNTAVQSNSSTWNTTSSTINSLSSTSWNAVYNTTRTLSSTWNTAINVYTTVRDTSGRWNTDYINHIIEGNGLPVTVGSKGVHYIATGLRINSWRVYADASTTLKLDIRRFPAGTYKATSSPTDTLLTSVTSLAVTSLTGSGGNVFADISAGDIIEYYVLENNNATRFTITLIGTRIA